MEVQEKRRTGFAAVARVVTALASAPTTAGCASRAPPGTLGPGRIALPARQSVNQTSGKSMTARVAETSIKIAYAAPARPGIAPESATTGTVAATSAPMGTTGSVMRALLALLHARRTSGKPSHAPNPTIGYATLVATATVLQNALMPPGYATPAQPSTIDRGKTAFPAHPLVRKTNGNSSVVKMVAKDRTVSVDRVPTEIARRNAPTPPGFAKIAVPSTTALETVVRRALLTAAKMNGRNLIAVLVERTKHRTEFAILVPPEIAPGNATTLPAVATFALPSTIVSVTIAWPVPHPVPRTSGKKFSAQKQPTVFVTAALLAIAKESALTAPAFAWRAQTATLTALALTLRRVNASNARQQGATTASIRHLYAHLRRITPVLRAMRPAMDARQVAPLRALIAPSASATAGMVCAFPHCATQARHAKKPQIARVMYAAIFNVWRPPATMAFATVMKQISTAEATFARHAALVPPAPRQKIALLEHSAPRKECAWRATEHATSATDLDLTVALLVQARTFAMAIPVPCVPSTLQIPVITANPAAMRFLPAKPVGMKRWIASARIAVRLAWTRAPTGLGSATPVPRSSTALMTHAFLALRRAPPMNGCWWIARMTLTEVQERHRIVNVAAVPMRIVLVNAQTSRESALSVQLASTVTARHALHALHPVVITSGKLYHVKNRRTACVQAALRTTARQSVKT